ncbi:MAG: winged helix-turn-helix transcriptional regulator [Deltaproteobacteria bacterium]|nr:winged helix-turn-helix transcriptional regulator [Deltaproteobacteria bacterium]
MRDELGRLRRFNRLLTQRIGLLDERYLGSPLPFAQARLLYEVAVLAPLATHHLRRLLAVDAAALSRGLVALQARRFVRREVDPSNARNRIVEVTAKGRQVLATLDRRADERVGAMTAGLAAGDRRRLLDALDQARRLLVGAVVRIERRAAHHPDAQAAQAAYLGEIARRFGRPLDHWNQGPIAAAVSLVVADGRRPMGCGALREIAPGVGEIKRMWLHPDARGLGLGARLLAALEAAARGLGHDEIRLDTNDRLREAIALYEGAGYRPMKRYNDNPDATRFYAKQLRPAREIKRIVLGRRCDRRENPSPTPTGS